ncbi:MAG: carboxypeptidase regulatory-like domain-containing protein [Candidatus Aenigmarchaeota archaeon]|nr:carboxypeptidase regulatory-like domain-containing protein [Candidatus Aenigmarchaeota archaeon]
MASEISRKDHRNSCFTSAAAIALNCLACLVFALILPLPVFSLEVSGLEVSPEIWLSGDNSELEVSFLCLNASENSTAVKAYANISGPGGYQLLISDSEFIKGESIHISKTLTGISEGQYSLVASCEQNGTVSSQPRTFWVSRLTATIVKIDIPGQNPALTLYPSDNITFWADVRKDGKDAGKIMSGASFEAYIGSDVMAYPKVLPPKNSGSYWSISADLPERPDLGKTIPLRLVAIYQNQTAEDYSDSSYEVVHPLTLEIIPPEEPYELTGATTLNITVRTLLMGGRAVESTNIKFSANLDGEERQIKSFRLAENNLWILEVALPFKEPSSEPYILEVSATYENLSEVCSQELPVWYVVALEGQLVNSQGQPVSAEISIGSEEVIQTGRNGEYYARIIPGWHDLELMLSDRSSILYRQAELTEAEVCRYSQSPIKYDSFDGAEFGSKKIIAFEFGFGFRNAEVVLPYDDYGIDKGLLEIYQCLDWNFPDRSCKSAWEPVRNIHTDNYVASFNVDPFFRAAFAIGERKSIRLEMQEGLRTEYFLGEGISVSGKVVDGDGNGVSDATVYLKTKGQGELTAVTGGDGSFSMAFSAPGEEGSYTAEIRAEKGYLYANTVFWPYKAAQKKELTISLPNYVDMDINRSSEVQGSVRNTGQAPLKAITLYVENSPFEDWLLSPQSIEELGIGEERNFVLRVTPKNLAGDYKSQYSIEFVADGEAKAKKSLLANIRGVEEESATASSQNSGESEGTGIGLTGYAVAFAKDAEAKVSEMASGIEFLLVLVVIALVLLISKKRTENRRQSPQESGIKKVRAVRDEIMKGEGEKKDAEK